MTTNVGRNFIGFSILIIGLVYLMSALGLMTLKIGQMISTYWPIIIVVVGLYKLLIALFQKLHIKRKFSRIYFAVSLIIIGSALLENRLNLFLDQSIGILSLGFALLILYIGIMMVFFKTTNIEFIIDNGSSKFSTNEKGARAKGIQRDGFSFLGEIRLGDTPWALEDSQYSLGIGELYVDLSKALIPDGTTYLDLSGWIGEIAIIVPEDLDIEVNASVRVGNVDLFGEEKEFSRHTKYRSSRMGSKNTIYYKSDEYDQATKKVHINASVNIGEISINSSY